MASNEEKRQNQLKPYMKYSGLAFQMILTLVGAAYGGMWLDEQVGNKNPWWTIGLMLVGVIGTIYMVIKSVSRGQ